MNLRAVVSEQVDEVLGFHPDGGGVVVGVDADEARVSQEGFVQVELHLVFPVVEQAQRGDGTGLQSQQGQQIIGGGEGERTGAVLLLELLQVYPLVPLDGNEVVIALLVVSDEQVFGVRRWVRQRHVRQLRHVVDGFVLCNLVPDIIFF